MRLLSTYTSQQLKWKRIKITGFRNIDYVYSPFIPYLGTTRTSPISIINYIKIPIGFMYENTQHI